ncbi:MAG TPA: hypothetical protein VMD08_05835 [Candidatus Baltobacteraceae bacterium]|nr:hypothetical protein [Candidatus Baltobacteraceae bacterium]
MTTSPALPPGIRRLQFRAAGVGVLALLACAFGAFVNPAQFFQSYLEGYLFWIGVSLGCLGILMLYYLVGGSWGVPALRLLEAGARTLPLMALLFLPFAAGMHHLYPWARPEDVAAHRLIREKQLYLNLPGFWIRTGAYFAIWLTLTGFLTRWSLAQDRRADVSLAIREKVLSAPGLILYGLTMTFAAIDWAMSLEPEWYSTIFGMLLIAAQGLQAMTFVILVAALLVRFGPLVEAGTVSRFKDLGNLTLAFLMLWMYMAFSQLLIVWAENLNEEIPYYLHRIAGGWDVLALLIFGLQFALPFFLLLFRAVKCSIRVLPVIAGWILMMNYAYVFWMVAPTFHPAGFSVHWMDLAAPIGIGGVWIGLFLRLLQSRALIPLHDPRIQAGLQHAEG